MANKIIQQLLDGMSIDELWGSIENIPLQQLQDTIETTDNEFKKSLSTYANVVHTSMQSHHSMGSVDSIRKQFITIETCLLRKVANSLPFYQQLYISFIKFFIEDSQDEKWERCLQTIQKSQQEIFMYNNLLALKSKDFLKYIEAYQSWVTVLTQFVPKIIERHEVNTTEMAYSLSRRTIQSSEFLVAQQQLVSTIRLQLQNNQMLMTDIFHIVTVSKSLLQNTISAQQFFEQEYVGSINILKRYTTKKE